MADDRPTLEELRVVWKKRVEEAERQLAAAREEVRKLEEELRSPCIPSPDIHYAFQSALRREMLALENYAKGAMVLNDLAVHGAIPKE